MSRSRISRSLMPTSNCSRRAERETPQDTRVRAIRSGAPDPILGRLSCPTSHRSGGGYRPLPVVTPMAKAARMLLVVLTYACAPSPRSAQAPNLVGPKAADATEPPVQKKAPIYDLA